MARLQEESGGGKKSYPVGSPEWIREQKLLADQRNRQRILDKQKQTAPRPTGHLEPQEIPLPSGDTATRNPVDYTPITPIAQKPSSTNTIGASYWGSFMGGLGVGYEYAYDDKGNIGILRTKSLGGGTPALNAGIVVSETDADSIHALEGKGFEVGGSAEFGRDLIYGYNDEGTTYSGKQDSIGAIPTAIIPEMHGKLTDSDFVVLYDKEKKQITVNPSAIAATLKDIASATNGAYARILSIAANLLLKDLDVQYGYDFDDKEWVKPKKH